MSQSHTHGNGGHAAVDVGKSSNISDVDQLGTAMEMGAAMNMKEMMKMYFHFGFEEVILLQSWHVQTIGTFLGSCVAIFVLAVFYEALKVLRETQFLRSSCNSCSPATLIRSRRKNDEPSQETAEQCEASSNSVEVVVAPYSAVVHTHPLSCGHSLQTLLHMLQMLISYLLMLIFMTYNVWLCAAVLLGSGAGFFAFAWRRRTVVDFYDHCH